MKRPLSKKTSNPTNQSIFAIGSRSIASRLWRYRLFRASCERSDYPAERLEKFETRTLRSRFPAVAKLYAATMISNDDQQTILADVAFKKEPVFKAVCDWLNANDVTDPGVKAQAMNSVTNWRKWLPGCFPGEFLSVAKGVCDDCPVGYHSLLVDATSCVACSPGASRLALPELLRRSRLHVCGVRRLFPA